MELSLLSELKINSKPYPKLKLNTYLKFKLNSQPYPELKL